MFPYTIQIPKELKQFVPELQALISEYDCKHNAALRDGVTAFSIYFESPELRNEFISNLNVRVPMCAGFGMRLRATTEK
jgi:hypothetical protein